MRIMNCIRQTGESQMMKRTLTASSLMLALAACGGGGDGEGATLASDTLKPVQTAPGTGQPPAAQPPSSAAPAPNPPQASPAPPEGVQPPVAEAPVAQPPAPAPEPPAARPAPVPAPPVATPPPSNRPVAAPTSGSWVVACRTAHSGQIVHGIVTTAGLFSVDDGVIDLTGQPEDRQALRERDAYNPEVSSQTFKSYGSQTLVIGIGDDTRPRWVGAYDSVMGGTVRQWECSTVLQTIPAAQQALCYASKEPLTKGLGPPVVVGFDWQDSRVFVDRADAPSVRYSLGQARDVTMPFEGRASDGTNLRCW